MTLALLRSEALALVDALNGTIPDELTDEMVALELEDTAEMNVLAEQWGVGNIALPAHTRRTAAQPEIQALLACVADLWQYGDLNNDGAFLACGILDV